jgi:mRNA-degrading endonuclease YafQ of YafQ-DinJ toxin-antitoxin module
VNRELLRSSAFARDLRTWIKTHPGSADEIEVILRRLAADAFEPSLQTHKLRGPRAGCWACSGGYDLRIIFEFIQDSGTEAILLLSLGTHDQVY